MTQGQRSVRESGILYGRTCVTSSVRLVEEKTTTSNRLRGSLAMIPANSLPIECRRRYDDTKPTRIFARPLCARPAKGHVMSR